MNLLLVLEHHFIQDNDNNIWCERVIDYNYIKRYLMVFDNVYVCARLKKVNQKVLNLKKVSGENVKFIPLKDFYGVKGTLLNICNLKKTINKSVKSKDINCIILRVPSIISICSYSSVKKANKPFAIEMVMSAEKMFVSNKFIYSLINNVLVRYVKTMCLEADGVSYVTDHILQEAYPCKYLKNQVGFTSSYSSIDLFNEDFHEQKWELENRPLVINICHTGYMDDDRKGQKILIDAVKILVDNKIKVHLTLIGDGIKRTSLENLVRDLCLEDNVKFTGAIKSKKEILNILKESHLFVMPTMSEGLPRSIIEAMAVSLPCIASDVDGIPELLDEEYLVHEFDALKYANKIEELCNDWPKMIVAGKENFKRAHKYEATLLADKRKSFYKELYNLSNKKS